MEPSTASSTGPETVESKITVRYWASARATAGLEGEQVDASAALSLAALVDALVERHDSPRLRSVLDVCSVLVGDRPAGSGDRAEVWVEPGDSVEFLPPFAGG
ncbi:MoaD/ThiS family protein [Nocardioides sp.]|uniref:MoaD/ThiS family protein n=1 Tax=Nocardioides sp. TaxID=35761 RepID=UPI0035276D74